MSTLIGFMRRLTVDEEGQTLTEYGLILFFIAVAAVLAVTALGDQVVAMFDSITDALSG